MIKLRAVQLKDASEILQIYKPFVQDSLITFEVHTPSVQQICDRIETVTRTRPWLVAENREGQIIGYAYGSQYREREAYQWSSEVSVYVSSKCRQSGVATQLYRALLSELKDLGFYKAYGVITIPNEPSIRFHEKMGFRQIAVFPSAGYKLGQWADVGWWEIQLKPSDGTDVMIAPRTPRGI